MRSFVLMLQFMTRIPINKDMGAGEGEFAKGIAWFPTVGLIIGGFDLLIYYGASLLAGGAFPVVCVLLANLAITGGLHIDGLADTCDGLFSARSRERMLEIMKDSRIGTNGAIAIAMDFLLKVSLLNVMGGRQLDYAILLSPVAAKTSVVLLILISDYARKEGMGGLFLVKQSPVWALLGLLAGTAILAAFLGVWALVLLLICGLTVWIYKAFVYTKIQGMTGDTLGAANEVIEIIFLLAIAVLGRFGI